MSQQLLLPSAGPHVRFPVSEGSVRLVVTSALLVVTGALLVVTRSY